MKFKLKTDGKVKYSNGETAAFKLLSSKPLSSTALLEKIYTKTADEPFSSRQVLIGTLKSLRRKITANREPFKLLSTPRSGPIAMEFWLEGK